jgi:hypothetical protein
MSNPVERPCSMQWFQYVEGNLEFVNGGVELLRAVLHGYAGGLIFMK